MPTIDTPVGPVSYSLNPSGALDRMWFGHDDGKGLICVELERQIVEFFEGKRKAFDFPLEPSGTPFQKQVWAELLNIPCGETRSYAQIARAIGHPTATRAVGAANGANPIALVIPCHRVIGSNGKLTGYGGGLDMKSRLLEFEREFASGRQLSLWG
jgi:methylated-DNA-[protein]-cysteine S-methyltransferase